MIEYSGIGSLKNIHEIKKKEKAINIFLVTGKNSYDKCGAKDQMDLILKDCHVTRFSNFSPGPSLENILSGLNIFCKQKYDLIIAVGGGSPIDVAKAIKFFYHEETSNIVPLVVIPTTAGSGSEATYYIVYYINGIKQSKGIFSLTHPDYVIFDYSFLKTLSPLLTASTGMDAFGQAIESFWSINSNDESRNYSSIAIKLIMSNLRLSVKTPSNLSYRKNMMLAANYAGKAINIAKTTACHAISYFLSSEFNINHGHAVALTLAPVFRYNMDIDDSLYELRLLLGIKTKSDVDVFFDGLMNDVGLDNRLSKLGIRKKDIRKIAYSVNIERLGNNPRKLFYKDILNILEDIY